MTKANSTGKSTPNDIVMTQPETVAKILAHFKESQYGSILEPCRGSGEFYNAFKNKDKRWCEITEGVDFFDYNEHVDWIITNPPFSIFDLFLEHSFKLSDNVVFLCPLNKVFKNNRIDTMIQEYGGIKEVLMLGTGSQHGFGFGFPVGCIYYQRNYTGDLKSIRNY